MSTREIVFYGIILLVALILNVFSVIRVRKMYKTSASQQRVYLKYFTVSLTLYYTSGFLGGVCIFHHKPLTSIYRVAALMDIPLYALGFLFLCILYALVMLFTAIASRIRKNTDIVEEAIPVTGIRKIPNACKNFGKKHPTIAWLICYTVLFGFVFFCVFSVNIMKNRGFIWRIDGKSQYLPYMSYMSDYLKEFAQNIGNSNYTIRMYDFTIGMGEDVRAVFRIHPTEFLSVFFKQSQLELLYNILMVVRYYLAGLAFYIYCRHKDLARPGILVASFAYIFSGYGINVAARHPMFNSPVIFLPLLLLAMDRLIEKKGYLFFTFMVALSMSTSYYFLYMNTIALGIYALVEFAGTYEEHRVKEFFAMLGRTIFFYLLGIGISAACFLPTVWRALTSERVGAADTSIYSRLLSYTQNQPIKLFASTMTGKYKIYDLYLAFAVIFLPAVVVLFFSKLKKNAKLKVFILIEIVAVMIPAFGFVMSAFSSISNRWIYILALTGAYTIAVTMEDFKKLHPLQWLGVLAVPVLYWLAYTNLLTATPFIFEIKASMIFLGVTTLILLFISIIGQVTTTQLTSIMLVLSIVSLTMHGTYLYGNDSQPFYKEFIENDTEAPDYFNKQEFIRLSKIADNSSFYRSDEVAMRDYYENTPAVFHYNGTSIYNSVINSNLVKYHTEVGSIGIGAVHRIYNLDGRSALEALASVKYYQTKAGITTGVPYGFKRSKELSNDEFWVYKNKYPLSIGYTYTSWIDRTDYEKLSPLQKQQVMLDSAVLDKEETELKNPTKLFDTSKIIEENAKLTHISERLNEGENYFELITDHNKNSVIMNLKEKEKTEGPGFSITIPRKKGYEVYLKLEDFHTDIQRAKIKLNNDHTDKTLIVRNQSGTYSLDRDDYYINLGYCSKNTTESIRFHFYSAASYTLGDVKLCYVPMNTYKKSVQKLQKDSLTDVSVEANTVSGTVLASENEILVFSIPYSSGWSATIDGKDAKLFRANTAYMGLALEKGKHEIKLTYETPGLRIGVILSIISIALFLLLLLFGTIRKIVQKKKRNPEEHSENMA